ncbi:MAG TPA: hypothetical protein PLZ67_05360, partial [Bacteroidales bacterium]|nr:hypothetical protein [Bacteroidales bacterium]
FPLSATFKIFLADEAGTVIDSIIPDNNIPSGTVNAEGKVTAPSLTQMKITLNENQTTHLYACKKAIVVAKLNTGGISGQKVKFYPWYHLNVLATGLFNIFIE